MRDRVEVRLSFTNETYMLLKEKAHYLGVPVTQFLKHIIISALEDTSDPVVSSPHDDLKNDEENLDQLIRSVRRIKLRLSLDRQIKNRWKR